MRPSASAVPTQRLPWALRLWRIRLRWAVLLALPAQILVALWLATTTSKHETYASFVAKEAARTGQTMPPFLGEQWRYFARDELRREIAGLTAPAPPLQGSPLETYALQISAGRLRKLDADLPDSGKTDDKRATLTTPDGVLDVKVRYMGDNHWHWLYDQKSWRVRLPKDTAWRDRSTFGFKNAPSALLIDEPLVTDVAASLGLLTPTVRPVQLLRNGHYAGLYLFWDVTDESLLRRNGRMPGSIWSGDGAPPDPATGVSLLFADVSHWQKEASRNAERADDRTEIERLLAVVDRGNGEPLAFHAFARRHLDLDRYATFVAIDRAFGSLHHDWHHNHKLYFDPYRGRFEPIEWDLNDWMLELRPDRFDVTLNPLLVMLRRVPTFDLQLQRRLRELLLGELHPDRIAARLRDLDAATRAARAADTDRDRRNHDVTLLGLPAPTSTWYSMADYDAELAALPVRYAARRERLLGLLDDCSLAFVTAPGADADVLTLDLESQGQVASRCSRMSLLGRPATAGPVNLYRDHNGNGRFDGNDPLVATSARGGDADVLTLQETLWPALRSIPFGGAIPLLYGQVDLVPGPQRYRYFLTGPGVRQCQVEVQAENAVTGAPVNATAAAELAPVPDRVVSCPPWRLPPEPPTRETVLGPGEVAIAETVRYDENCTLRVLPGTTLKLGGGVSVICRGRVLMAGTEAAPIRVEPADPGAPWGTFALQGPATAGSRMLHVEFAGGTANDLDLLQLTGMVNVADTHDIAITACRFGRNEKGDDALHWGYVTGGAVSDSTFDGAPFDAFDLDLCTGVLVSGCTFRNAGNDGLDLMTCEVQVRGCVFDGCNDKGISVGEATKLRLADNRWQHCTIGLQVKDESLLATDRLQIQDCKVALSLLHKNLRYERGGRVVLQTLVCDRVGVPLDVGARCTAEVEHIVRDGAEWRP